MTIQRMSFRSIKLQKRLGQLIALLILTAGSLLVLIPIVWMLTTSVKSKDGATTFPPQWIPRDAKTVEIDGRERFVYRIPVEGEMHELALMNKRGPIGNFVNPDNLDETYELEIQSGERIYTPKLHWENYSRAMTSVPFATYFKNSFIRLAFGNVGNLISCVLVAYGFARFRAKGLTILFLLLLSTIMLPSQVTLIPTFVMFTKIGWYNSLLPMIVPTFFANAWDVFLLRQFFSSIPLEYDDAARIDGCGRLGILWHIILPQSLPALITVLIFHSLWAWNDFFLPLIYLQSSEKFTVSIGLQQFMSAYGGGRDMTAMMAASTVALLPVILVFFFAQRLFIQGVVISGIKG
jgi:multiple sugar transport system permease protein